MANRTTRADNLWKQPKKRTLQNLNLLQGLSQWSRSLELILIWYHREARSAVIFRTISVREAMKGLVSYLIKRATILKLPWKDQRREMAVLAERVAMVNKSRFKNSS